MSDAAVRREKDALRLEMKGALAGVSPWVFRNAGEQIAKGLALCADWIQADTVAVFSSLSHEVDTGPCVDRARRDGKNVLFPRMRGRDGLDFVRVEAGERLVPGRYGVLEPPSRGRPIRLGPEVLVLVPGLAFDRFGGRLGRGAGYYDRALAGDSAYEGRARRLGVGLALQVVDRVPMTPLDVRMHALVTENGLLRFE